MEAAPSCGFAETLEPQRQAILIGPIHTPLRQMHRLPMQALDCLEHRAVLLREQAIGDVKVVVRVDADQVGVERGVMDLRKRDAIAHNRLAQALIAILHDVGGV